MSDNANPVLVDTYGTAAAKFGKGAQSIEQVRDATDARRDQSDASKPREYSTR